MLSALQIKNVALIEDLEIEFSAGFNVLLGETGAGKSIIFDALSFVCGGRADRDLVRSGKDFLRVDATFCAVSKEAKDFLSEQDIDCDGEIILSRAFYLTGKSWAKVNGFPVTAQVLKKIGAILVESVSQHEGLELINAKNHLAMLDKFGGRELAALKEEVSLRYARLKETQRQIDELGGDLQERERTKSLLEYQIKEIENASLEEGEEDEITERLDLLNQSEKICMGCERGSQLVGDDALQAVDEALSALSALVNIDEISDLYERLDSAKYELSDIAESLKNCAEESVFSQDEFDKLDARRDLIKSLCRKYGSTTGEVLSFLTASKEKLDRLSDADEQLARLDKLKKEQQEALLGASQSLTNKRKDAAEKIEQRVIKELADLGMHASFKVEFSQSASPRADGCDDVAFTFSANVGQEIKSLAKTASGGELSRFMLAIKNIFAETGSAQTIVFDEIDAGISGEIGVVVGNKLSKITSFAQVLCITHLPQVATFGDNFLFVDKFEKDGQTYTSVKNLDEEGAIYQIARMSGGDEVTEAALCHVREMRQRAKGTSK